jgi:hypothetical protein
MQDESARVSAAQIDDDGTATPADLIGRYRRGPALLRQLVEGMPRDALLARPIAGKMSTQEVVCHTADCDQFLADRIKRAIAMDLPLLIGVEGESYLRALHYDQRDIALDLALLDATRSQMAADLDRLDDAAWQRQAVHSETGLVTVRQLVFHAIRHLEMHARSIAEKRAALGI